MHKPFSWRDVARRVAGSCKNALASSIPNHTRYSADGAGLISGRKIVARIVTAAALLATSAMWASDAHAQVVFNEDFGTVNSNLPTALSSADPTYLIGNPCLNGFISLDTSISPTPFLHHNTDVGASCSYFAGQAVWFNINPIPVEPDRTYIFSYSSARLNTVSDPVLSHQITPNAGGSIAVISNTNTPWAAPAAFVYREMVFKAGPGTTSVNLRINNASVQVVGNDFIMDDIVLLDVTPQLSKAFSPTSLGVGGSSTLTFTITNTAELAEKSGWSFTDTLPAGLTVASDEIATDCPAGVLTAPVGASAISLSGNLTAGLASCTATVPVTANTPGTYTNDASNITASAGLNPPASTSVTFNTLPNFACNANMYLAQSSGGPTTLFQFDSSNNPFIYNALGTSAPNYNAIGFNPADGYIYGATQVAGITHLLRIGSNGLATDLGAITGGGINATTGGFQNGEIGTDGVYYLYNQIKGLYRVNLTTRVAVAVPLSRPPETSDLAWYNGLLYGVETNGQLVSIHPTNGTVTNIGAALTPRTFGAMISASNGIFAADNAGGFFRVNPTTGATTLISSSPASVGNDGAKCATTPLTFAGDLSITKTDNVPAYSPGTDTTYTIVVSNSGPFGVQGATVEDPLPAGITTANWTCVGAGGGICGAASGTGGISSTVSLPVGGTATYTLTLSVPAGFTGDLVNTASVTSPPDSPDSNPGGNTATDTNVPQAPAMTIVKTGTLNDLDGDGLLDLGETINYSFLVTNTGNVTLTGVTVTDPLVTVDQGPQTLAPGGTFTFTASYAPNQADIDAGRVTNTATGTGTPPSGPPITSPPDTVVVPPDQTPGLVIEKTGTLNDGDGDGLLDLGETISYSFRATNAGSVTLTGVTVNDPLLTNAGISVTPSPQTLAPGGVVIFTATYTPTQAEIDAGQVRNTATGTGTPPSGPPIESPPDTVIVPPDQAPGMTIDKTGTLNDLDGDGLIDPGETISYAFRVQNTGAVTLTGVTVDDPLLANAGISVSPGPQTLAPGGVATFTAMYTPTQAEIDSGRVANTATGTGTPPSGPPIESPPDTVTVPPDQASGLTIAKTGTLNDLDGDGFIDLGETINYAFLVTNTGAVTLTNVSVNDPLVTVNEGPQTLAPGASFTFTAAYTPTQADIDAGRVSNTATGTGTPPSGPPIESPPDTVLVPPDQTPGLTVEKTGTLNDSDGDGLLDLGETISYSFLATNTGAVTLSNVTISDPLLQNAGVAVTPGPQTLAPGGSATFTASYTPTQADIDAGRVSNTATGTGTPPSGPPIESPPDTVVVPPDQTPGLTVEKTGTLNDLDGDDLIDLGETISYSFLATNTGTVTLTGVTINDPLLQNAGVVVTPAPQTLAPGGVATFTAIYTPTQADIDNGSVVNTATGTGTDPGGGTTTSPPDTVTVPPEQTPGLSIEKTGTLNDLDGDGLLDLGETISYAFLVQNTGTVTQTNVSVNDPLVTIDQGPQTLAPGGSFTFTATYTPTQADIDNGSVVNTATGTGTDPGGGTTTSPPDTVTVPPDQTPGLSIEKTGTLNDLDGDNLLDAGETISYAFLVRNTGAVTLADVMVDDPLVTIDQGPQTLAPGAVFTFTATYTPTQADIDNGSVVNTATATGTPPGGGTPPVSPPDTVTIPPSPVSLGTVKIGVFNDLDGDGNASLGDTITYTVLITNEGGQTATGVWPLDAGPTFNGRPAANSLSTFEPGPMTLAPGQSQAFTATYVLDQTDIDNAAGLADGVENTARAQGTFNGINVPSSTARSEVTMPAAASGDISVAKIALRRQIRRGEEAPFAITITNHAGSSATGLTIMDTLPSGFRFVEGSASIGGVAATPVIDGRRVIFDGITVPADSVVEIRLRMLALSSAGPGEHVNRASVTDAAGNALAPDATASVEIMIEPVFDCSEIIGRVFDDRNRNGYQDEGELGLPGVRLATVKGWLVTTDAHGRFHVACAALPDQRIGSNFIMKLDPRTLPSGYRLTTENPRVVRLTAGKMTSLDFGVAIGRVVRLDLQDQAFEPGSTELLPQWAAGVDQLIDVLDQEQSVLRLSYIDPGADPELAEDRLRQVSELIRDRWERLSGQYRLEIEMRVETGL